MQNGEETCTYEVTVTYTPPKAPDPRLSSLTIGSLKLAPSFDPDTEDYTADTTNNSNTITATATDTGAAITIDVDGAGVPNGTAATWQDGGNKVTIQVLSGESAKTYTVAVTKS